MLVCASTNERKLKEVEMSAQELNDTEKQILADLYAATNRTVDDLPYTVEFDAMLE